MVWGHEQPVPKVRAVLAPVLGEAPVPQQSCSLVEAELSLTSHSGTANSYAAPKTTDRPAWPEPRVMGHPKLHRPCQEQRASAKHPVIGKHEASSAGGPASVLLCTLPPAKGSSDLFTLNPNHPRTGSCMPETAPKDKITPRENNIHLGRLFLVNTPNLG